MCDNCDNLELLQVYLKNKARNHNSYKHYAPIDRILQIVKENKMYLVDGKDWNDTIDSDNFTSENSDFVNFGKCFSYAQDESVAMWMLYGGADYKGAMIDFTRRGIKNILNISNIKIGFFRNNKFIAVADVYKPDFTMDIIDIVYYNKKTRYLKHSDESCCNVDSTIIDKLGLCGKSYPWSYENECRLIVSVKKEKIPDNCSAVEIDFEGIDLGKSLERVFCCPNYKGTDTNGFKESQLEGCVNFKLIG